MIWFEYKFFSSLEIIQNIKLITQYSIIDILILIFLCILSILAIYYLIPFLEIYIKHLNANKAKKIKKELIKKIILQKNIEEDIEKELK